MLHDNPSPNDHRSTFGDIADGIAHHARLPIMAQSPWVEAPAGYAVFFQAITKHDFRVELPGSQQMAVGG